MPEVAQRARWPVHAGAREDIGSESISSAPAGFQQSSLRLRQSRLKRLTDIVGAGLGLLILLPFLALIAVVILIESRGPVFFRQRRSGLDGTVFNIYKFRSMNVMEDGADVTQATRGDNRVTWVGKFLRRSSIDELPQLINVLKGEMSLVGPRPHAVAHDQYYTQMVPNYHLRFHAKPGITGMAQIEGFRGEVRDIPHMQARVARDLEYIQKWSPAMDVRILFLTVTSAPFHRSAY
ncbi:MAG TPA: exopolysaccharide biosynthesis polyprenyl glycosylphosphotransferase [Rhizomicrobium sp.]|nr:exopolysaccharide biosynthesis polyprenyl glycosylphosphotransferase [Rhizomicrobium sp.]